MTGQLRKKHKVKPYKLAQSPNQKQQLYAKANKTKFLAIRARKLAVQGKEGGLNLLIRLFTQSDTDTSLFECRNRRHQWPDWPSIAPHPRGY
ncbi:MAG: hypothetical protein EVB10_07645 [Verrucomicrobiaceae bacterium]|nr:MAG: hypothetical protein EVB10_07645 [Verrucomicrobiaceae bacterium]